VRDDRPGAAADPGHSDTTLTCGGAGFQGPQPLALARAVSAGQRGDGAEAAELLGACRGYQPPTNEQRKADEAEQRRRADDWRIQHNARRNGQPVPVEANRDEDELGRELWPDPPGRQRMRVPVRGEQFLPNAPGYQPGYRGGW
jgi:hypothetical protein